MAKTAVMKIWNVDLGLAVHIKAPNGKYVVIDLGSTEKISPLKDLYGKDVGYMIITHPHLDHFSDIENVGYIHPPVLSHCRDYSYAELIKDARMCDQDKITRYCNFVNSYTMPVPAQLDPRTPTPFNGLTIDVYSASGCDKSNRNNYSSIVVLKLGRVKIVVCGDNERESFDKLMNQTDFREAVRDAWVLVASHHGRESGYHEEFVKLVSPYITIISDKKGVDTSASQKYSSMSKGYEVIDTLSGTNEKRLCLTTRKDGNIEVKFGENDFWGIKKELSIKTHV